eukprot:TRINITY_DN15044_c0_g1_i1.p1 TRINITY_DN15044_c0_g1~~TRINITY_DN15044_c0_g1_i1.p1  ORF type:complete len:292 (+),score=107.98 TRINITY_DN15044_c0_g1_i1:33-908(+)
MVAKALALLSLLYLSVSATAPLRNSSAPGSCTGNVLIILSSADSITLQNGKVEDVGYYIDEFAIPSSYLLAAGFNLHFANPKGNTPAMDQSSNTSWYFAGNERLYQNALNLVNTMMTENNMASPTPFSEVFDVENYDAVFVPGGHPPMIDLWDDADLGNLLWHFHNSSKPTAMICHGPMAATSTAFASSTSEFAYYGYNMTVFSTWAEQQVEQGWGGLLPYYPEDKLRQFGADLSEIEENGITTPHVIQHAELITGQNPFSAPWLGAKFVAFLEDYCNASPAYFKAINNNL